MYLLSNKFKKMGTFGRRLIGKNLHEIDLRSLLIKDQQPRNNFVRPNKYLTYFYPCWPT